MKIPGDRILSCGIPAALLVHGAVFLPQWRTGLVEFLGDASYSIYLVQVATIPVVLKLAYAVDPSVQGDLLILSIVVATIFAGVVNYMWFERPAFNRLRVIRTRYA